MKALKAGLALGIAFLLPLLANMTVRIWWEPPESKDYYDYYSPQPKTNQETAAAEKARREQDRRFEVAQAEFNTVSFYVTFPIGILTILSAYLLRRRATLAAGVFFGGISIVAFASYASWETLPGWLRYVSLWFTLLLLGALAILIERGSEDVRSGG